MSYSTRKFYRIQEPGKHGEEYLLCAAHAGDMLDDLTMTYNRTRQAVITSELIEIISGAEAL